MNTQKIEGIILSTVDFKDYDLILTLFTLELGMIKLFYKGGNSRKRKAGSSTSPLTRAEFVIAKGRGDLWLCREVSVKDAYLELRKDLEKLEAGCDLIKVILNTQLPDKPAPELYILFNRYLSEIGRTNKAEVLTTSFRLKVLRHEGLFGLDGRCSVCQRSVPSYKLLETESYCAQHAPPGSIVISEEEAAQITLLAFSLSLSDLKNLELAPALPDKIRRIFPCS